MQPYEYLKIWGFKKALNTENKIIYKVFYMKSLTMKITNQKLSFVVSTVKKN